MLWIRALDQTCVLRMFSPVCASSPLSLDIVSCRTHISSFNEVQLLNYFFKNCAFGMVSKILKQFSCM